MIILIIFMFVTMGLNAEKSSISVFYKERKPSQKVLKRVKPVLDEYRKSYNIQYYNIEDSNNADLISQLGLPDTHFPFAIVLDGKFNAKINDKNIAFVHFPEFMRGIGRHEGNWSLEDLKKVLKNNNLLDKNHELPVIDEGSETSECGD
jgi:hypothetical protein